MHGIVLMFIDKRYLNAQTFMLTLLCLFLQLLGQGYCVSR